MQAAEVVVLMLERPALVARVAVAQAVLVMAQEQQELLILAAVAAAVLIPAV
jgi:hypothetical protein